MLAWHIKGREMANIGATTAFYKVETSLTRANNAVSKSMERLATGKANANAGDRASYVAMADTFRLDFVGTKAGIKGASVAMGYLETGMRVLDAASALLSRLQELAVLGANGTNTNADHEAINLEAEAIADEFNRLMTTSTYKGKDAFVEVTSSQYVSLGGRDQKMTYGIGKLDYSELYSTTRTIDFTDGPNDGAQFNLVALPSESVQQATIYKGNENNLFEYGKKYEIVDTSRLTERVTNGSPRVTDTNTDAYIVGNSDLTDASQVTAGTQFTWTSNTPYWLVDPLGVKEVSDPLTTVIESVQGKINQARVEAGSQYAALESAVNYTTDLTAQYELGYNIVNDVNFSMETAHLAKNQIIQQAATAMLAQANQGQKGLLQLIQSEK